MNRLRLAALVAICLPLLARAAIEDRSVPSGSVIERADARAERIHDAPAFLREVEAAVEMARDGDYGRLKRGGLARVERARDVIVGLLDGRASAMELEPDDRIALFNAQEAITAELNNDDKGRKVCKREPVLGSRLPKTECLTVGERERRAEAAQEGTEELFRSVCGSAESDLCPTK